MHNVMYCVMKHFIYDSDKSVMSITSINDIDGEIGSSHTRICDCYIMYIGIFPSKQRTGYGTKLLKKTEEEAKKRGCTFLSLCPLTEAKPFWFTNGYKHSYLGLSNHMHKYL